MVESDSYESSYWCKFELDFKPYYNKNEYCLDGSIDYRRHDHCVDPGNYKFIDPQQVTIRDPFDVYHCRDLPTAAVIGRRVYKLLLNRIMFFEPHGHLSYSNWSQVSSSPCITSLIGICLPKLLSHKGRLYILGCKVDGGDENAGGAPGSEFGVIFDPRTDSWVAIPMPPVEFLDQPRFSTTFLQGHLLLMLPEPWIFDNVTGQWGLLPPHVFNPDNGKWFNTDLHLNVPDIISTLVEVEEESTVYWINTMGRIYAHNLDTRRTQFGPIIGLEYTHFLNSLLDDEMDISLFHVMGDLFCLLYQDPMSDSCTSNLHCLVTRVIKLKSSIFMIVIGCFCAPISGSCCFRNSFLMR